MDKQSHNVSAPVGVPEDGGVFKQSSFDAPNPAVDASHPGDLRCNDPDPLAGKSGKDSLVGDELILS